MSAPPTSETPIVAAAPSLPSAEDAPGNSKRKAAPEESSAGVDAGAEGASVRGRGSKRGRGGRGGGGAGRGAPRNDSAAAEDGSSAAAVPAVPAAPQTPIQQQFSLFAAYLDERNDRRESVYQSSRDLTRASKKLITQLQRLTHVSASERVQSLATARATQLADLHKQLAATTADFKPEEYHRYAGAYSPGFQEFIESQSFLHYLEHGTLLTHGELESSISHSVGHAVTIPLSDFVVGLLDLGGELMRYATNSITSSGDRTVVGNICSFLRDVYAEYQKLQTILPSGGGAGPYKEMGKKMEVWLQSLAKIETLAYKLHIRGAELPDAPLPSSLLQDLGGGGGGGAGREHEDEGQRAGGGGDE